MSRKKHRDVNETANDVKTNVEGEDKEMNEKDENKGFFYKVGEGLGKGVNTVVKVAKSKPAKMIAVLTVAAASAKAGYEYGKSKSSSCDEGFDGSGDSISEESGSAVTESEE